MTTEEALSPRDVVSIGFEKAKEMEDFLASGGSFKDLRLEELRFDDRQQYWHVVIGFDSNKSKNTIASSNPLLQPSGPERVLKDMVFDKNGNFVRIERP